jgi:hypothetical protein
MPPRLRHLLPSSMPGLRLKQRHEILILIGSGRSDYEIAREHGCSHARFEKSDASLTRAIRVSTRWHNYVGHPKLGLSPLRNSMSSVSMTCTRPIQILLQYLPSLFLKKSPLHSSCALCITGLVLSFISDSGFSSRGITMCLPLRFREASVRGSNRPGNVIYVDETSVWLCNDH